MKQWGVYILECCDGTFYTGSTDDLQHRFRTHAAGKGAKYTRGRGPLILRFWESCESRSEALKREYASKQLSRADKQKLIQSCTEVLPELE